MQNRTVLIFGQSVRFLSQSAVQAGYKVWAADSFGDQDTIAVADRWQPLPDISSLTTSSICALLQQLSQNESCHLVCGSGIEYHHPFLEKLPENIFLCGNSARTIQLIKTPTLFFSLLARLGILYPETVFCMPDQPENFIVKSASGLGGTHIHAIREKLYTKHHYFQQKLHGLSGSALFLANGKDSCLLSINRQYTEPHADMPYRLGSIETPWKLSRQPHQNLIAIINKISHEAGLVGLNSLDFMLVDDKIYVLEVNPRPSASAELLSTEYYNLFQLHVDACHGFLPSTFNLPQKIHSLHYLFATHDVIVPEHMRWPDVCHDLPGPDTFIKKQQPVCSILISSDSRSTMLHQVERIKQHVMKQLWG